MVDKLASSRMNDQKSNDDINQQNRKNTNRSNIID